ncbi:MAG: neurotransmitter:Na+ symporter, family [Tenuifilum sp.]|jgi:NSS family neurotransmitter:Na+ symporter|uniref:sodium-dependent transporter n=1 Tax=Tenuifilum sp. TaxID=2760880 RepID=UPI0024AC3C46|nr:sodium-dependent transporter [Tenuifilum sp.]MDI3525840.1 neurotransmitter:Na+ symporter, family [Tenuifilum sp.]
MSVPTNRDSFGSKFGIIAAAAGSAVGLGNIWKFPYITGQNGGGAFLLIYLFFVLLLGVPVMISEFTIGRKGGRNVFGSFKALAPGSPWYFVGIMGVVAAFVILSFYSAVAGWTLEYIIKAVTVGFSNQSTSELGDAFTNFLANPIRPIVWQLVFMVLTAFIVAGGIKNGIEKYNKFLMPILVLFLIILCIRSVTLPNASKGLAFLFKPDFSKVSIKTILFAMGQAFFSLSLGMGALITYASYFRKSDDLGRTAVNVSLADTFIAILAGTVIFPAVFSFNIEPTAGPSLVFITLPEIFSHIPLGNVFGIIFFVLLAVAALTSTVSVLEVVVAYFAEELKISRKKATVLASVSIFILGIFASLSFGPLDRFTILGKSIFDALDFLASNILLPGGGLLIVIFVGWYLKKSDLYDEISNSGSLKARYFPVYRFIVRFIAPLAIAAIFIYSVFFGSLG